MGVNINFSINHLAFRFLIIFSREGLEIILFIDDNRLTLTLTLTLILIIVDEIINLIR